MKTPERVRRRLSTARDYEEAARCLEEKLTEFGPSPIILKALAFEIKLKALVLATGGNPNFFHDYVKGWNALSGQLQEKLVKAAKIRFAGHANFDDILTILSNTEKAFLKYRYEYELNESRNSQEIEAKSLD